MLHGQRKRAAAHLRYLGGRRWSRATGTWTNLASLGGMGAFVRGVLVWGRVAHPTPLADRAIVGSAAAARAGAGQVIVSAEGFPFWVLECPGVRPLALAFALRGLSFAPLRCWSCPLAATIFAAFGRLVSVGLPDRGQDLPLVLPSPFVAVRGALLQYSCTSLCQKRWS